MGVVPAVTRTASTASRSFMERSNTAATTVISLMAKDSVMAKDDKERRQAQLRSKTVVWKEPMQLFQRMSSRKMSKGESRSFRQKEGQELNHRPSKFTRFWRKLRFDGVGKKGPGTRPEWLNYDSQSYAMNFEKDREAPSTTSQPMPKISGPQAREIVTVLLQRSPSTNRNSGCILIPKPVSDVKQEANAPLWKRRSIDAPSSLEIRMKVSSTKRRTVSAGA